MTILQKRLSSPFGGEKPGSVAPVNGHLFLPKYGHRFSPPAAIFSPHWWP